MKIAAAGRAGALLGLFATLASPEASADASEPRSASVPFTLDHNRMSVAVEILGPNAKPRRVAAWVDTGSESLSLSESLARELGLDVSSLAASPTEHSIALAVPPPTLLLGGRPLDLDGVGVRVHRGDQVRPGVRAQATLPASVFRQAHVVFDYPAGRLTVARSGVLQPRGVAIPCSVSAATGLIRILAKLDGETVALGVDTGSAGTWVSAQLTSRWRTRHPSWPVATGAVGSANFFGFPFEAGGVLMRLPELRLGSLRVRDVALLGLDQQLFDWYSRKSAGPVSGFIGANVLKRFRVEVDFPRNLTYWEAGPEREGRDLDIVGLTLRPEADGRLTIAGVAAKSGKPTVEGVQVGDTLLHVDALDVPTSTMGAVVDALRGVPGVKRVLVLERGGRRVTVEAKVTRFP